VTSWSVMAAAGGCELVTGWKRSPTYRVCVGVAGFEQLTKTRSRPLESVHWADPVVRGRDHQAQRAKKLCYTRRDGEQSWHGPGQRCAAD
jgi:hypothetical protein